MSGVGRFDWLKPSPSVGAVAVAAVVALGIFAYFAATVDNLPGEIGASGWVQTWRSPAMDAAMDAASAFGKLEVAAPLLFLTVLVLYYERWRAEAVTVFVATGLGRAIAILVKELVERPRPSPSLVQMIQDADGWSFPSGHVTHYSVFFGTLAVVVASRSRPWAPTWALVAAITLVMVAVGLSRIYLGVHWLGDVVGGYAFGGAFVALAAFLFRRWRLRGPSSDA